SPPSAKQFLNAVRCFAQYCIAAKAFADNPTAGIKGPKRLKSDDNCGFYCWSVPAIEQYRRGRLLGTTARLALELHLNPIQRSSDVIRFGRQHIGCDDVLRITQKMTRAQVAILCYPSHGKPSTPCPRPTAWRSWPPLMATPTRTAAAATTAHGASG